MLHYIFQFLQSLNMSSVAWSSGQSSVWWSSPSPSSSSQSSNMFVKIAFSSMMSSSSSFSSQRQSYSHIKIAPSYFMNITHKRFAFRLLGCLQTILMCWTSLFKRCLPNNFQIYSICSILFMCQMLIGITPSIIARMLMHSMHIKVAKRQQSLLSLHSLHISERSYSDDSSSMCSSKSYDPWK